MLYHGKTNAATPSPNQGVIMSHYMTALAMKQKGLKPGPKIVLYWLADHHNGETGLCCPSLSTLAKECEMSKATVVRHLDFLEKEGLIVRSERHRENGSQTSSHYHLSMKQPVSNCDSPCLKMSTPPVSKCDPHNLGNNNLGNEPIGQQGELLPDQHKPSKQKRAVQLPDGWVPNDRNIQDALDRNFSQQEIDHEADKFRNYHQSKCSAYKNWDAAWRTWLGNARKFARNSFPAQSRGDLALDEALERARISAARGPERDGCEF